MRFVLGITGGIGSGKTAATDHFQRLGVHVIDADVIAHQLVEPHTPALAAIAAHFGQGILSEDSSLNRQKLRTIVFSNKAEKKWLENYLHPLIRKAITAAIKNARGPYCVLSAPLLLEGDLYKITDKIVVVDCTEALQIERSMNRDNSTRKSIERIIQQQISRKERRQRADIIIDNNGSIDNLKKQVNELHNKLLIEIKS